MSPAERASRRILVVDDDADSVTGLSLLLRAHGHDVRTATTGDGALAEAERFRPELVFLDLGLGAESGLDVARELRRMLGAVPALLALTGYDEEGVRERCLEAGFDRHLVKPILDFDALRQLVLTLGRAD